MLTEREIAVINEILETHHDVEIQHRQNGLVILKTIKKVCYKQDNKSDNSSLATKKVNTI